MDFLHISRWVLVAVVLGTVSMVLINLIVVFHARPHIVSDIDALEETEVVIILGAGVYQDGRLTPVLQDRVDTAVAVYKAGKANKILMSGDNGSRYYNEVSPVHAHLLEIGIPPEDIFLDYAGFDTYDTMYRARVIFGVTTAIVVTQSFHLPRAVFLADAVGIEVQGFGPAPEKIAWRNSARESLARVKALLDIELKTTPTYLGERIPISGDGRESVGE